MKSKRTCSRKPAVIANSRWLAYATAGAASAFTCANSAEAAIHYSGLIRANLGKYCVGTQSVRFQLDQPGDSIRLRHSWDLTSCSASYGGFAHFGVTGLAGNGVAGFYNPCPSAHVASVSKLKFGAFVSRRPFLARSSGLLAGFAQYCSSGSVGQFDQAGVGFIGFKFNNGSGDQYGWARVRMTASGIDHGFWFADYAYADPGEPIRAGQTSNNDMVPVESDDVVPQEGSLGALALGAAGLLAWRKSGLKQHIKRSADLACECALY